MSSDRLKRLKELKNLKNQSIKDNKKELYQDYEKKKLDLNKLQKLKDKKLKATEELNELELNSKGIDYNRLKNMNYTISQDEDWNLKLENDKNVKDMREFQNYKQLAEQTYLKKLKLKSKSKSKDSNNDDDDDDLKNYEIQIRLYNDLKKLGYSEEEIITKLTNDSKLNDLIVQLKETDEKSYKKRKIKSGDDGNDDVGFINDKNKQFNDKLNRHYDKYLDDLKDDIKRGSSI
ncbi:hypothetical protein CANARDRAFT_6077 [[Candida] arabinofermentans NRRL YB-2248]|uniref:Pre-mRNA-splicing factor SYF2 n=1 Tax=[Candida] arabinofermentans NRRL YB-2248 TaxID=983967 RepID=A0A1E4T714_9ASCO|nr:hypothetical protein CANARDRAFT_6077 [[Candida] arabinofermentans NRRL YB-2248]